MNKLEETIFEENLAELTAMMFNLKGFLEDLPAVGNQDPYLEKLKEKYFKCSYKPVDINKINNNLTKLKLVLESLKKQ